MNAVAKPKDWHSLHRTVLEDAKLANGMAHLESPEVSKWIRENGRLDIVGELCEALSDREGKDRERLCLLLDSVCEHGDNVPQRHAVELIEQVRQILTDHCIAQAQHYVEQEWA